MAHSFSSNFFHLVFSTKHRQPLIQQAFEKDVWKYAGGIVRNLGCEALEIGGIEDHLHSLLRIPPKFEPSKIIQKLKANSSRFVRNQFYPTEEFRWQDGFGIFTVSKSAVPNVIKYIRNQRKHHSKMSYEEEFRELLRLHDLDETDFTFD